MTDCIVTTYRCKVCGAIKGETNHWLLAICDVDNLGEQKGIAFCEWNHPSRVDLDPGLDNESACVCGQRCATILFERWLHHRSFEPIQPNRVS